MRRTLTPSLLALLLLAGCLGDDEESPFIGATVYGASWSANASEGTLVFPAEQPDGPGVIYSEATRPHGAGSRSLTLGLPVPADTGTYLIDGVNVQAGFIDCSGAAIGTCQGFYAAGAAGDSLRITRVDPGSGIIEGTFQFYAAASGEDEIGWTIPNGHFRIYAPSAFGAE